MSQKTRFDTMREFFDDVGHGKTSGIWEATPPAAKSLEVIG